MVKPRSSLATSNRQAGLPTWAVGEGQPPAGAFIALVPGADAPLIALGLPASLRGIAREDVARRQAQDRLGAAGAALDIRPARLGGGDRWTRVVVADRAQVVRWRGSLGQAAARCRALVPDYAALPTAPGLWTLHNTGETLCVRLGPEDGFTAEPALAERLMVQALHQASATQAMPRAVLWTGTRHAAIEGLFEGLNLVFLADDLPAALHPQVMAHGEAALDFARDPRADADAVERRIRRLLWPAVLLVLAALGWAGATALSIRQDHAAAVALDTQTLEAARRDLLGAAPILDLRVQVVRAIDARRGGAQPRQAALTGLDLLRATSEVLTRVDAQVFAAAMGRAIDGLVLDIVVDDFRALDSVLASLSAAGLIASVTRSGIDPDGGVSATLSVHGGAP